MPQDLEQRARDALDYVTRHGVEVTRKEFGVHLDYGLKHSVFDQAALDQAQRAFEALHKNKKIISIIEVYQSSPKP